MRPQTSHTCLLLALLAAAGAAAAQAAAPDEERKSQRVQRIHVEDSGAEVDEVRYGGQTQSITVKPKNSSLPAYEIQPADMARSRPGDHRDGLSNANGQRVWNVLKF